MQRMWVEYVWPKCTALASKAAAREGVDLFWVECRPEEAAAILALNKHDTSKPLYPPARSCHREELGGVWQFFLVSRDADYVESTLRLHPFTSNGESSHFLSLPEPRQITSLAQLKDIELS
jgi:hypothetical protein